MLVLGGLLQAAAFPPSPLAPFIFIGFLPALAVLELKALPGRRPYLRTLGYLYVQFFVWNLAVAYWLMLTALKVEGGEALVSFFGGFMASALNPILMSLPFLIYIWLRRRGLPLGWALLGLGLAWLTFEHLHFRWDLTWSWLTLGHALSAYPWYLQYLEFTGILGASALIVAVNLLLFYRGLRLQQGLPNTRAGLAMLGGLLLLPLALYPLLTHPGRSIYDSYATLRVRIVQPNIDPYEKFRMSPLGTVKGFVEQIDKGLPPATQLVVLPETAIPSHVPEEELTDHPLTNPLIACAQRHKMGILIGYHPVRYYEQGRDEIPVSANPVAPGVYYDSFNGASILGVEKPLVYKKSKLVPFIERAPFMEDLAFLGKMGIDIGGGFGAYGLPDSVHNLYLADGTPIAPLICYESQFADFVAQLVGQGATLLTAITNDGWWGQSSGYVQHAQLARLRAIETRRDVARSANTGISGFIDARGYYTQELGWGVKGCLDGTVQLRRGHTLFVRLGSWPGWLALFGLIFVVGWTFIRPKISPQQQ